MTGIVVRPAPRAQLLPSVAVSVATAMLVAATAVGFGVVPRLTSPGTPQVPPVVVPATPSVDPSQRPTPSSSPRLPATPSPTATPTPTPDPTPVPTPVPTPLPTAPPSPDHALPGGIYLDILTARRGYADWARSLLDTIYMLPSDYHPGDLVDSGTAGLNPGYPIRSFVVPDLRAMVNAARAAGAPLAVVSGFRSHAQQITTFNHWVTVSGYGAALRTSARPGHSEHQLGTTLDFTSAGGAAPWEYADWAATPAGAWMRANAWRHGFVMSYPAGSYAQTGYDYEPWHYRYVGRDLAAAIQASGLTPRGYLWATR